MSRRHAIAAIVVATCLFGLAMALRHVLNPWLTTTVAAVVAIGITGGQWLRELRALASVPAVAAAGAIALGLLMSFATHAVFQVATSYVPALRGEVEQLYAAIASDLGPALLVPLVVVIVFAEELIWRGLVFDALNGRAGAYAAAVLLYALPQAMSGSWILLLAAVLLGSLFVAQRALAKRLADPLLTHVVWSVTVFCLVPLVGP